MIIKIRDNTVPSVMPMVADPRRSHNLAKQVGVMDVAVKEGGDNWPHDHVEGNRVNFGFTKGDFLGSVPDDAIGVFGVSVEELHEPVTDDKGSESGGLAGFTGEREAEGPGAVGEAGGGEHFF